MDDDTAPADTTAVAGARLAIGLLQGIALYLLWRAGDARAWPATAPELFAPLAMVAFFVPLAVVQGLGAMRLRTLVAWALAAAALLAMFGWHDRFRIWPPDLTALASGTGIDNRILPSFGAVFFSAAALFITHALIAAGDSERRWIARYESYFDTAWKLDIQLGFSLLFVGVLWGVLKLGAGLFKLIDLDFLERLIDHAWFAIPVTALAAAAALHLTDMRARLIAGIRGVALALLSWLLPLMTLLAVGFLASLVFTGLEPLWRTRTAAALLLDSAAALVVLINTAYREDSDPAVALRLSGAGAAFALVPLVALAGYAIGLRVHQYGWTEDRVASAACLVVAACYAAGYAASASLWLLGRTTWLKGLETCNIATAVVVVIVIAGLFTWVADPARLAVASQVARLKSGAVTAEKFDFRWLRFNSQRYGRDALAELSRDPSPTIRRLAAEALIAPSSFFEVWLTPRELAGQLHVYASGKLLPQSLLRQDWTLSAGAPPCLTQRGRECDVFFAELNGDTRDELIFTWGADQGWDSMVLGEDPSGRWAAIGALSWPHCKAAREAMRKGQYAVVAPTMPKWRAVEAANSRFDIEPPPAATPTCPN